MVGSDRDIRQAHLAEVTEAQLHDAGALMEAANAKLERAAAMWQDAQITWAAAGKVYDDAVELTQQANRRMWWAAGLAALATLIMVIHLVLY